MPLPSPSPVVGGGSVQQDLRPRMNFVFYPMPLPHIERLTQLGNAMVGCQLCPEASTVAQETPARCVWTEEVENSDGGVVVVGLNPGRAGPNEIQFYANNLTYQATVQYLQENSADIPYFAKLRRFVNAAFNVRSVHWTEIAKCELLLNKKVVPLQMRRSYIELHLKKELALIPTDWPIVAAGRVAHEALAVLCTDRLVIGVPHPTGEFGRQFSNLFAGDELPELSVTATAYLAEAIGGNGCIWLGQGHEPT